jgi:hypothetical protein
VDGKGHGGKFTMSFCTKVLVVLVSSFSFVGFAEEYKKMTHSQLLELMEKSMSERDGCDVLISQGDGTLEPFGGRGDKVQELKAFQKDTNLSDDQARDLFKEIIIRDKYPVSVGRAIEYISYYPDESVKGFIGGMITNRQKDYFPRCMKSYMRIIKYRNDELVNTVLHDKDQYSDKDRHAIYSALINDYKIQDGATKHLILSSLKDIIINQASGKNDVNNSILQYMAIIDRFLAFHDKEWAASAERLKILEHLYSHKTDILVRPAIEYYTNSIAVLKSQRVSDSPQPKAGEASTNFAAQSVVALPSRGSTAATNDVTVRKVVNETK